MGNGQRRVPDQGCVDTTLREFNPYTKRVANRMSSEEGIAEELGRSI